MPGSSPRETQAPEPRSGAARRDCGIAILGAGLSGLAAAQRLERLGYSGRVYEEQRWPGGRAASDALNGYTFDQGPHVSFTAREPIKKLLADAIGGRFREHRSEIMNWWRNRWIRHPVQCHLHGLPPDLVEACVVGFVEAWAADERGPFRSYADWALAGLGRAICDEFLFKYTRKYWTVEAAEMTAEWVGQRVYRPSLREVVRGVIEDRGASEHYLTAFRYPEEGGFGAYVKAVEPEAPVLLGHRVVEVDFTRRRLQFANGRTWQYAHLISSIPLCDLVEMGVDVPRDVKESARRLAFTSVVLVDLGLRRDDGPFAHWVYCYDEDLATVRAHWPHRLSPRNAPAGKASLQVEVYYSRRRPRPAGDLRGRVIDELQRIGTIESVGDVELARERDIVHANILFDHDRHQALRRIGDYLKTRGVELCGRYGEWRYLWSDEAIESGWGAAERMVAHIEAGGAPRRRSRQEEGETAR